MDRALRLLARKSYTQNEMEGALERGGVTEGERHAVVARLRELGYMDDLEVARGRARILVERGSAPRFAERRLGEQGVAEAQARTAAFEAAQGVGEAELLDCALRRILRGRPPGSEKERRRAFRALVAKGHRPALAARALGLTWDGDDD
jgi:regulatory protein